MTVKEFNSQYWEKKPLHVKRNSPYYADVFTTDDIRRTFQEKEELLLKRDVNICRVVDGRRVDYAKDDDDDDDDEDDDDDDDDDGSKDVVLTPDEVWQAHDQMGK
jgi:ribosomal protein L16 Arg81 hydroxylase